MYGAVHPDMENAVKTISLFWDPIDTFSSRSLLCASLSFSLQVRSSVNYSNIPITFSVSIHYGEDSLLVRLRLPLDNDRFNDSLTANFTSLPYGFCDPIFRISCRGWMLRAKISSSSGADCLQSGERNSFAGVATGEVFPLSWTM